MKNLIMKLLGLNVLIEATVLLTEKVDALEAENKELKQTLADLETKVDEIEIPDANDFVSESDVNNRIESYLNDNDYCSSSYVDDEIESKVSEKVEEAIEELDLTDKVREVVDDMDKASFGDTEEMRGEITRQLRVMLMNEIELKIKLK